MNKITNKTFIQILWDRNVPQYLGTYLAVGFGLLQFVEFITKRYKLSDVLVDKYLLVWLALLPAIIIIIYFGGQLKFKSTNLKWPRFIVITNILFAFLAAGFLFNGKQTINFSQIELVNEEGQKFNVIVPARNKVKTVASFQFKNLTGDLDKNWYGVAFSQLLQYNLNQRPEFYTFSAYSLNTFHDVLGLPSFISPNIGMQREIAVKSRNDYFTSISYNIINGKFEFKGKLYSSKDSKIITELTATNEDPYVAIDKLKQQIFDHIPEGFKNIENQTYMPVSTLITDNFEALKYHTESRILFYKHPTKLLKVLKLEQKAIALDPSCTECYYYMGDVLYGLGRKEEAITALKRAIQLGKSLPQRMQFLAKGIYYSITKKVDSYYKLQELHRKMFPYEFAPYQNLMNKYFVDYGIDKTKALIQEAIDNGNIEKGLLVLFYLQLRNEEYPEALNTLDRYTAEFPDRDQERLKYASVYEKQGDINAAKKVLLEEETLDPLNAEIQIKLAEIEFKTQQIDLAYKRINNGLLQATTLTDSIAFLWYKVSLLKNSGQIKKAFEAINIFEEYAVKRKPINIVLSNTFESKSDMYQSIGESDRIEKILTVLSKYSPQHEEMKRCLTLLNSIMCDYNTEIIKVSCKSEFEHFGKGYGGFIDVAEAYQMKDYHKCLKLLELDNNRLFNLIQERCFLANIYAKAGDIEKAKEIIKKEIDKKTDEPIYYYQMATLLKKSNPIQARKYVNIALNYWENSDANYIPFQRAISLSKELYLQGTKIKL
ncbi:MAG: tetratricopeptide repeat protein [Flavobacteriaceae bacterium]|nr:tetratricopeptide repeat protein [Flavobacteriaceae bacterium]